MDYDRSQIISVIRDAAEFWFRDFPQRFRSPEGSIDTNELRRMLLATCGVVNSGIDDGVKPVARHFELLERQVKESLVDEALGCYRSGEMASTR